MREPLLDDVDDITAALGASPELSAEMNRLIEHFDVASMHAEEQALFLLEVGRLIHDDYVRRIEEVRASGGGGIVPPYAECARATVSALLQGEVL
jgi:hypothetical protein